MTMAGVRPGPARYGWDAQWQAVLQRHCAPDAPHGQDGCLTVARVLRVSRHFVWLADEGGRFGPLILNPVADPGATEPSIPSITPDMPDIPDIPALPVIVGDWLVIRRRTDGDARHYRDEPVELLALLPRRGLICRRDPSRPHRPQPLATNIDCAFLLHGLDRPLRPGRIERFLALAHSARARPAILLTKADGDDSGAADTAQAALRPLLGAESRITLSGLHDESGPTAIRHYLGKAGTGILLGESGAGKSTMVNRLLGRALQRTGPVRAGDAKGRHTTSERELIALPGGGALIDTPGMREVGPWGGVACLDPVYPEIVALAGACHFPDCSHGEEPGCALQDAVASGKLSAARLARYAALRTELAAQGAGEGDAPAPAGRP